MRERKGEKGREQGGTSKETGQDKGEEEDKRKNKKEDMTNSKGTIICRSRLQSCRYFPRSSSRLGLPL